MSLAIGIDVGSSYSHVGVFRNGHFEIIPDENGATQHRSWIFIKDHEFIVGDAAVKETFSMPGNGIYAVITIPAHFGQLQRSKVFEAAAIADLEVLQLLQDTSATAVAYTLIENRQEDRNVLFFDFGGGKLECCVATILDGRIRVKGAGWNCQIGGDDFTYRLLERCLAVILMSTMDKLHNDPIGNLLLRESLEMDKKTLFTGTTVNMNFHFGGLVAQFGLRPDNVDLRMEDIYVMTMACVEKCLKEAGVNKFRIHEVVMVGGCSYIPKVQTMLRSHFPAARFVTSLHTTDSVVYGAAAQAARLNRHASDPLTSTKLQDVASYTLTVTDGEGVFRSIKKNKPIPWSYSSCLKNSPKMQIFRLYEGENPIVLKNRYLGQFQLSPAPKNPRRNPTCLVNFGMDVSGRLEISYLDNSRDEPSIVCLSENSSVKEKKSKKKANKDDTPEEKKCATM